MIKDDDKTISHTPLIKGSVISHYRILEMVGAGGMGKVHLAVDTSSQAKVAIKSVDLRGYDRAALDKEIVALKSLKHEHVIRFIESFESDTRVYIVTEYIDGRRLSALLKDGPPDLKSVERFAMQILRALEYIHDRGIIHSDLKPSNILIDSDNNVKLIDFGVARTASAEIAADIKEIRGTLHYMSPEQAEGKPYDIRSDIFAFGIVLYEMCTGRRPFDGEYDMAVIYSILYEDPVPPDRISDSIPAELSNAILRLLAKEPSARPGSATEVIEILTGVFESKGEGGRLSGNRIAIFPLQYPRKDLESQLLAEGLLDEIKRNLQQLQDVEVISPQEMGQRWDRAADTGSIRSRLGADYYLQGSVRRVTDRVRIYFTIHSTVRDAIVWSEKFDSPIQDLFDIIDAITARVSTELQTQLKLHTSASGKTTTTNPEAYELYLLARSYYVKYTKQDIEYARSILNEALRIDPDYALAYVGLADCHCAEYMNCYDRSEGNIATALTWAERALTIAPRLPEAYRSLGRIMQITGKSDEARSHYLKAVTYKGDYFQAFRSLGWLAVDTYRYDEAITWVRKSLSIKSTDIETVLLKGLIHLDRKESKLAINDFTRCLELRPDYGRALSFMGMAYFQLGRIDQAISHLERALELGGDINTPYLLGYYYLTDSAYARAARVLRSAVKNQEIAFIAEFYLGLLEILKGSPERAKRWFRKSHSHCCQLVEADQSFMIGKSFMAKNLALLNQPEECRGLLDELRRCGAFDGSFAHDLAHIHAILGEADTARGFAERAGTIVRGPTAAELAVDPLLRHFLT